MEQNKKEDITMNLQEDFNDNFTEWSEDDIVAIYPKKPGLDDKNGKYRILGAITHSRVFRRKDAGTNIAPAIGYKVVEEETGREILVTKQQAVFLCAKYGMKNAYIAQRVSKETSKTGEVLQELRTTYLMPYPTRKEAFTQDDRLVTAFKLDSDCIPIKPLEIALNEEECTPELWRIILQEQKKGNKGKKKDRIGQKENKKKNIEGVLSALKSQGNVRNPFK